ncbi:MAG: enoyl-CoA hydratase/isomerase family protein [Chloroflexota bacterium]
MSASIAGANPVHVEYDASVAWLTLAEPETGNALNTAMIGALRQALLEANSEANCRVVVLQAQGPDFCKGLDLEWAAMDNRQLGQGFLHDVADCLATISQLDKPVIAWVEGAVSGGGVGLVAACDLVLASAKATFILPEVIIGMIPALISPFLLRRMSLARLRYLTLSSRSLQADEAKEFGLVDEVESKATGDVAIGKNTSSENTSSEDASSLHSILSTQIQRLFRSSPAAVAESKRYFLKLEQANFSEQTVLAADQIEAWLAQPAVSEALQEFAEGFTPEWWAKYRPKDRSF